MPRSINVPEQIYAPGSYSFEIDTPTRSDRAEVTLTRVRIPPASGWPDGELFRFRIFERDRGDGTLHQVTEGTMMGGYVPAIPERGLPENSPCGVGLQWSADRDKDIIRFEVEVLQEFRTAITIEFI